MPTLTVTTDLTTVELTALERFSTLHGNVEFRRDQVVAVDAVENPVAAPRGLRSPGLALPKRIKVGTWRARGAQQFAAARRGVPGVRLRLARHHYDELVLSLEDEAQRALAISLAPVRR